MTELSLLSAFLIGVAGSVHCFGMCGGIVSAFTFLLPRNRAYWPYLLLYNAGRIISYSIAGGIAGYMGQLITTRSSFAAQSLLLLSGIFVILLGCYIGNLWRFLRHLEHLGQYVWKYIQPFSRRFVPFTTPWAALPYGIIWGWLPCGLVYSTLSWSLASGSALNGALTMLFFGLGTLPALLAIGASGASLKAFMAKPVIRLVIAVSLVIYGLILIYQAVNNWL